MRRQTYTRALTDPESFADVVLGPGGEEDAFFEDLARRFPYFPEHASRASACGQDLANDPGGIVILRPF